MNSEEMTIEQLLIRRLTQAIKDIIGAANNDAPYTREEFGEGSSFLRDYNDGYAYLEAHSIEEIA
jgi:hypothetical protein